MRKLVVLAFMAFTFLSVVEMKRANRLDSRAKRFINWGQFFKKKATTPPPTTKPPKPRLRFQKIPKSIAEFKKIAGITEAMMNKVGVQGSERLKQSGKPVAQIVKPHYCFPHWAVVRRPSPPNMMLFPEHFTTMACKGTTSAPGLTECLPAAMEHFNATAFAISRYGNSAPKEFLVSIEVHTSCKEGCKILPHHCNENQYHHPDTCSCKCRSGFTKDTLGKTCGKGEHAYKIWAPEQCKCRCNLATKPCGIDRYWSKEKCNCICVPRSCPAGFFQDQRTCGPCKCRPIVCPPLMIQDFAKCTCIKIFGKK